MSKEAFIESMGRRVALVDPSEELRQMFKAFDRGCRGFLTRDDLRQVRGRGRQILYLNVYQMKRDQA